MSPKYRETLDDGSLDYYYNEKQEYHRQFSSDEKHHQPVPAYAIHDPRPQLSVFVTAPPRAALVEPPPASPVPVNFGDTSPAGSRRPKAKQGSIDWSRFSIMLHKQENQKSKESSWAKQQASSRTKYTILGWTAVIIVILGIAALLYWHFKFHDSGDTQPEIPSLGGFNGVSSTVSSSSATSSATARRFAA